MDCVASCVATVDSTPIECKIDTGADVTVISEDIFYTLTSERRLDTPDIPLDRPGGELLCLGHFDVTISHKGSNDHSQLMWFTGLRSTIYST